MKAKLNDKNITPKANKRVAAALLMLFDFKTNYDILVSFEKVILNRLVRLGSL